MSKGVPQRSSNAETRGLIGLLARRMPSGGPLPRRVLLEVALLGGSALLVTSALIHLILWSGSYRAIPVIGPLFLLQGIAGALIAVGIVRFGHLGTVVAGAGYMALTTAGLLTSSKVGLFGFQENLSTLYRELSINVQVTGFGLLIMAAYLIVCSGWSSRTASGSGAGVAAIEHPPVLTAPLPEIDAPEPVEQPAAPAPVAAAPDAVERLRWPAERFSASAETAPIQQVPEQTEVAPEAVADPVPEVPAAEELEVEPVMVAVQIPEDAAAVPDDIPEPVRGLLVREQMVLANLERSLGPDDPSTITSRINMAYYYLSAGSIPAATDLQERIVADSDRILGSNHPQTLTSRIKLAEWQKLTRKAG